MKALQKKQDELNKYIIEERNIKFLDGDKTNITKSEYVKNMILACHDEIREIREDINNPVEYIDALHFILSIANGLDVKLEKVSVSKIPTVFEHIVERIYINLLIVSRQSGIFKHWSVKNPSKEDMKDVVYRLSEMVALIDYACKKLNVSMIDEYNKKYEINIQRQKENY